jgi:hypothetical protein
VPHVDRQHGSSAARARSLHLPQRKCVDSGGNWRLLAIAIRVHNPAGYKSIGDLVLALPDSLASLRPHATDRELVFLSFWSVFQVWSLILIGYGFAAIVKTGLTRSLFLSFSIGLSLALLGVLAN